MLSIKPAHRIHQLHVEWFLSKRRIPDTTAGPGSLVLKSMPSVYGSGTTSFHLFTPGDSASSPYKHPLIIQMDGDGENNNTNIAGYSPAYYASNGNPMRFYNATYGRYSTFYILVPHQYNSVNAFWSTSYVKDMLAWAKASLPNVDTTQIYVTGLHYGGGGVYSIIADSIKYANVFAAAAAMVGIRNVSNDALLSNIRDSHLPLWVWQATNDDHVYTRNSNIAILTYQQAHYSASTPQVRFTLPNYGGLVGTWIYCYDTGHAYNSVDSSYFGSSSGASYFNNPNVYEWFLSKRRTGSGSRMMTQVKPGDPVAAMDDPQQFILLNPNPLLSGQQGYIIFNSRASGVGRTQLINTNGSVLYTRPFNLAKGFNRIGINTANLSSGTYLIIVYDTSLHPKTLKLIIN